MGNSLKQDGIVMGGIQVLSSWSRGTTRPRHPSAKASVHRRLTLSLVEKRWEIVNGYFVEERRKSGIRITSSCSQGATASRYSLAKVGLHLRLTLSHTRRIRWEKKRWKCWMGNSLKNDGNVMGKMRKTSSWTRGTIRSRRSSPKATLHRRLTLSHSLRNDGRNPKCKRRQSRVEKQPSDDVLWRKWVNGGRRLVIEAFAFPSRRFKNKQQTFFFVFFCGNLEKKKTGMLNEEDQVRRHGVERLRSKERRGRITRRRPRELADIHVGGFCHSFDFLGRWRNLLS